MKVGEYLQNHQNIIYQTFLHALNSNHLSHAYLLVGEQGTPLLESALFLAKSLVCEHPNPLACEECMTCLRIDEGNYADIIVIDGFKQSIKKDDIRIIEERFETSAVERQGKMIYIINHVENMNVEAINSLLKFLEEPQENIFAFLTCENESRVLPTIISRSQVLHFRSIDKLKIKEQAISLGVNNLDAELLCNFYNYANLITQKVDDKDYQVAKESMLITLNSLANQDLCLVDLHTKVFPQVKSKEAARYYLDMLSIIFKDLISFKASTPLVLTSLKEQLEKLASSLAHLEESLLLVMTSRGQIEMNINVNLLLDHIFTYILKGDD